jgi:endonuclease/exonuclease/phosphatase family metal-dependent hydrolase
MKSVKKHFLFALFIFYFISCSYLFGDTISIATFNIRIFSNNSRDDEELLQICNILKEFDFIAIQEARDTEVLDRTVLMLKNRFNLEYRYLASKKVGTERVKEIYVYLYRADKVEAVKNFGVYPDTEDDFIREPFIAMFKAGEFDFYVINIHSIYGDSISDRRDKARKLAGVYALVQSQDTENDVLLMGDFNLPPDDTGFQSLKTIPNMTHVNSEIPTSIKDRLYDNIWFQVHFTKEFTGTYGIIKFDEVQFGNDDKKASLMVSDHRPLWADFDTSFDDD